MTTYHREARDRRLRELGRAVLHLAAGTTGGTVCGLMDTKTLPLRKTGDIHQVTCHHCIEATERAWSPSL